MKQSKVLAFSNSNYEVSSDELQSTLRLGAYVENVKNFKK